ncbi:MAG: tRNA (N6-threonylcarbamoyladenosine(37)-N6)-methyltransferase TrmO [Dehalococcoidia bacterium]
MLENSPLLFKVVIMPEPSPSMELKAIGVVSNGIKQPMRHGWEEVVSEIVIEAELTEALDGLENFSHIIVLYWMHQLAERQPLPLKVHPMGNQDLPLTGRFATRAPSRPNPIGQATVELLERRANVLKVKGLDAIDGTPVIDIKPYIPGYDSASGAKAPRWIPEH